MSRRLTTEEWIRRSIEFHGEKYDYSKSIYTRGDEKIIIICPDHGEQLQRAESHWKYGPRCCSGSKISSSKISNASEFIEKARRKYGEKYDYSHVDYVNSHTDVIIVCPIHGMFEQRPANHINSKGVGGCLSCSYELRQENMKMPLDIYIEKVDSIHNDRYDYSKVKYRNLNDNIEVICNNHGSFFPKANMHLYQKTGCPKCYKKTQTILFEIVREMFPMSDVMFDYKHPKLKFEDSNYPMELDIWVPDKKLAIEYQGEQHFMQHWSSEYSDRTESLDKIQQRDQEKRNACKTLGIKLIEIDYTWNREKKDIQEILNNHIR